MYAVKLRYVAVNTPCTRITVSSYENLMKYLQTRFPNTVCEVTYKDEDLDDCMITDHEGFKEALAPFAASSKVLKLDVRVNQGTFASLCSRLIEIPKQEKEAKEVQKEEVKEEKNASSQMLQRVTKSLTVSDQVLKTDSQEMDAVLAQFETNEKTSLIESKAKQAIKEIERCAQEHVTSLEETRRHVIVSLFNGCLEKLAKTNAVGKKVWFSGDTYDWKIQTITCFEVTEPGKYTVAITESGGLKNYLSLNNNFNTWRWVPCVQDHPSLTRFLLEQMAKSTKSDAFFPTE